MTSLFKGRRSQRQAPTAHPTNSSKTGDTDSENSSHHPHSTTSSSSQNPPRKSKTPELKRSSTSNLLSTLSLTRELTEHDKQLQLEYQQVESSQPSTFQLVTVHQALLLAEDSYEKHKDKLSSLQKELEKLSEAIDVEKELIQHLKKKYRVARGAYREVHDEKDGLNKRQETIFDRMDDSHPYKIKIMKRQKRKKEEEERYDKETQEERKREEAREKEEHARRCRKEMARIQREKRLQTDFNAEKAAYKGGKRVNS
ncbi:hypothetical protein DID88_001143 [Monilinia fructigena]|uniref:Uncharacterized protein n=1 Tax=Monilinia fructigena TaxID=38457 RepID=A0A395IXP2_9HELO|nr:hypothetical protein DID88_001143 [Monilinia fructigena]